MRKARLVFTAAVAFVAVVSVAAFGQGVDRGRERGDAAIAARYASWALAAAEEGRWQDAETALDQASDFSDVSSDVSYLLALARLKLDRPAGAVLGAVRRALEADRWDRYGRDAALLLEAGVLIRLQLFDEALENLGKIAEGPERAYLRSEAFALSGDIPRFRSSLREAFAAYPGDPRFPRLLFDREYGRHPDEADRSLMDIAISRLPYLSKLDSSLAYRASPFIRDVEERRRLVAAYRATSVPDLASLPQALELGLVDEAAATEELFSSPAIESSVLRSVWALLRSDSSRKAFAAAAAIYAGNLVEDSDRDGYAEAVAGYRDGRLVSFRFDADQDGLDEIELEVSDGLPVRGRIAVSADYSADGDEARRLPSVIQSEADRRLASIEWQRYPFVESVSYDGYRYLPAPAGFPYSPVRLVPLLGGTAFSSLRFPKADPSVSRLTVRSLVSFSSVVERPGILVEGSKERIELVLGIPRRSVETVDGRVVSILIFSRGHPLERRVDTDLDGRMETVRRYKVPTRAVDPSSSLHWDEPLESVESDWNGDGSSEYVERYFVDGSVERSWDMDGDGRRERIERGIAAPEEEHEVE